MTSEVLDAGVGVDRGRLAALTAREAEAFASARPRSRALAERARGSLLGGVPMTWMMRWAGPYAIFLAEAKGARVVDVDGHEYVDLCLEVVCARPAAPATRINRGVLITPFHNMALVSPATSEADVDRHTEVFADALGELA